MSLFAELISPDRVLFSGEVESIVIPAIEGDMTILPGHQAVVTLLNPGFLFATDTVGGARRAFVSGGLVVVTGSTVTILADRATAVEELTPELLDREIFHLTMARDGTTDAAKQAQADIAIARLQEFKASFKH
jgi:F-type H+-transporting ATPase subunit epsilon